MIDLRPYQKPAIPVLRQAIDRFGAGLDGSDTGTGKTPKALAVALKLGLSIGIICPIAARPTWKRWCATAQILPSFIINYEKLRMGTTPYGYWEGAEFKWGVVRKHLLIFDEVHACKGIKSQNGAILSGAKKAGHKILMLSATAAENPLDMRHTGYALGLHDGTLKGFYQFAVNHGCNKNYRGNFAFLGRYNALTRVHKKIYPERGHRVRITELGDLFPPNTIIAESYDMGNVQGIYDELAAALDHIECLLENAKEKESPLEIHLRFRQRIELMRIPFFIEQARDLEVEGKNVVLFVNYSETLRQLSEQLPANVICGDQPPKERERVREQFQANETHFLVCQYQAGGQSLDLHDINGRPRVSLMSPTYRAMNYRQALGRIHRDGALSPALQYICFAADSVEEDVCASLNRKLDNIDTLNDGDLQLRE